MDMIGYAEIQQFRPDLAISWFQKGLKLDPLPAAHSPLDQACAYLDMKELSQAEKTARPERYASR